MAIKLIEGGVCAAHGFKAGGIHVGVKSHKAEKKDVKKVAKKNARIRKGSVNVQMKQKQNCVN